MEFYVDMGVREFDVMLYWIATPMLIILSSLGVLTNIITVIIMRLQGVMVDSCTPILFGMAVTDLCWSLVSLLSNTMGVLMAMSQYIELQPLHVFDTLYKFVVEIDTILTQVTCWIMTYLAFERMIIATFPKPIKTRLTPKVSSAILVSIPMLSFGIQAPNILSSIEPVESDEVTFDYNLYYNDEGSVDTNTLINASIRAISLSLVLMFNLVVIIHPRLVKKVQKLPSRNSKHKIKSVADIDVVASNDKNVTAKRRNETKISRAILVFCVVFLALYFPRTLTDLFELSSNIDVFGPKAFKIMKSVSHALEPVKAISNLIVHYVMNSKFKIKFKKTCCRCMKNS